VGILFRRPLGRSVAATLVAILVVASSISSQTSYTHYFGNLHAHTSYSDGSGTPEQAFAQARQHLDFIAVTEHNHSEAERGASDRADGLLIADDPSLYTRLKNAADAATTDGEFVAFWGQEFSTISNGNHSNVFQADGVLGFDNGDYRGLLESLDSEVVQFNHPWDNKKTPNYGYAQFKSYTKLRQAAEKNVRLIEVINGPGTKNDTGLHATVKGESFYKDYLARGLRLAPSANQDNHYFTWGDLTGARTVVLATELSRRGILQAIRARRCYATTDRNLRITFTVHGAVMGKEITSTDRDLLVEYEIADDDEPNAPYTVAAVFGNPKVSGSATQKKLTSETGDHTGEFTVKTPHANTFIYLRVTQHPNAATKRDVVITAPVWVLAGS
jgi:trimeric autotransporter adhesin